MAISGTIINYYSLQPDTYIYNAITKVNSAADATFSLKLDWTADQDVVYNTSTINWVLTATAHDFTKTDGNFNGYPYEGIEGAADGTAAYIIFGTEDAPYGDVVKYYDLKIGFKGTTYYRVTDLSKTLRVGEKDVPIDNGSFTVSHNEDGTLPDASISAELLMKNWYDAEGHPGLHTHTDIDLGDNGKKARLNGDIVIDSISTHAVILTKDDLKVKDFNDEVASVAVNYAMPSGTTGQIYLSLDGNPNTESTHLETVTGAGTHNYTFTDTDRRQLWTILDQGLDTKPVRFFIKSTSNIDGEDYREPSNLVNLRIVNYMPTLDPRVVDSNPITKALTGDEEKLIRYASTAKFTTGADAKKHYEIATESCTNGGGNPVYGATGEIPNVASNYFTFTATDNAGRRVQTGLEVPEEYGYWIPYVKLTCSANPTEMTADGDVAVTISGKYFEGNFSTSRPNKMYLSYELSKNNEEPVSYSRGEITPQVNGSDYSYTFTITGLEYLNVYDLTVKVSDELLTEGTVAHTILASTPIFDWGRQDFNFNVPVTITDGEVTASVPSIVAQGTHYSGWNYRKWSDGLYECWQRKVIPTMIGNDSSAAGWYSSGAILSTNISYPITFVEMPTVNVSLTPTTNTWALVVPGSTPGTTEETGIYQLLATYKHEFANRDYIFNYQVKGKWK